jgi:AcrR family transcriptional regulator
VPAVKKVIEDDSPKREAILAAALELFAERGFHGTTVPEVAEKAQVGAGTVYRYFASKEALVNSLYQRWKAEYGRMLLSDFRINISPKAMFHELWSRMGAFARKHPKVMTFLELHHHGGYLDEKSHQAEEALLVPIRSFVRDAQKRGALKDDCAAEVLMAVVYGAFNGIVRASLRGYLDLTPKVLGNGAECVWAAIAA